MNRIVKRSIEYFFLVTNISNSEVYKVVNMCSSSQNNLILTKGFNPKIYVTKDNVEGSLRNLIKI